MNIHNNDRITKVSSIPRGSVVKQSENVLLLRLLKLVLGTNERNECATGEERAGRFYVISYTTDMYGEF